MKTYRVYYDADCGLCMQTKRTLRYLDWFRIVKWMPLQQLDEKVPINKEAAKRELHLVTSNGKVYAGFYAMRRLFLTFPATVLIGAVGYLPFIDKIGVPLYRFIARNRKKLLRNKCDNGKCEI
ncbi:DUF393 domain-containing protein [Bacillus tianshenii]|nr:DUF393 domain-containing protein [Bacillus tianshenii]